MSVGFHMLLSGQIAEEPKLNSAAHSEPLLMSRLLTFYWQASDVAKPNISEVKKYTLLALVGDNAKGHGKSYGCVILVQERLNWEQ